MRRTRICCVSFLLILVSLGVLSWVKYFGPIRGLEDDDPEVRKRAAASLATSWVPDRVARLKVALEDDSEAVRGWASGALGEIGNKEALDALIVALHDETCEEHHAICHALGAVGEPALEPLISALQHEDIRVREAAPLGIRRLPATAEDPEILARVVDSSLRATIAMNKNEREKASASFFYEIGEPAVAALVRVLQDENIRVRRAAASALNHVLSRSAGGGEPHKKAKQELEEYQEEWQRHLESARAKLASLSFSEFSGDDLELAKGLTGVTSLSLTNKDNVTDAGLENLKWLTDLNILMLYYTQVTDAGLEHLEGLTGLERLSLWCPKVTDAGLDHLKGLTSLQTLNLDSTQVTDEGVNELKKAMRKCRIRHSPAVLVF